MKKNDQKQKLLFKKISTKLTELHLDKDGDDCNDGTQGWVFNTARYCDMEQQLAWVSGYRNTANEAHSQQ